MQTNKIKGQYETENLCSLQSLKYLNIYYLAILWLRVVLAFDLLCDFFFFFFFLVFLGPQYLWILFFLHILFSILINLLNSFLHISLWYYIFLYLCASFCGTALRLSSGYQYLISGEAIYWVINFADWEFLSWLSG